MVTTSMWSSSVAACALLVFFATAHADEAGCPAYHGENPLSAGTVFDGPPEERADLMPDHSKVTKHRAYSTWDVGYIYDAGRQVFLACRYANEHDSLTVPIAKKVRRCIYKTRPNRPAELRCD
jgi:hypothetical protein